MMDDDNEYTEEALRMYALEVDKWLGLTGNIDMILGEWGIRHYTYWSLRNADMYRISKMEDVPFLLHVLLINEQIKIFRTIEDSWIYITKPGVIITPGRFCGELSDQLYKQLFLKE